MAGAGVLPRSGTGIAGGQLQCCLDLRGKWLQPFSELLAFQGANALPWGVSAPRAGRIRWFGGEEFVSESEV